MTTARKLEVEVNRQFRLEVHVPVNDLGDNVVGQLLFQTDAFEKNSEKTWASTGNRASSSDEKNPPLHVYSLIPLTKGTHSIEYNGPESETGEYGAGYRKVFEINVKGTD